MSVTVITEHLRLFLSQFYQLFQDFSVFLQATRLVSNFKLFAGLGNFAFAGDWEKMRVFHCNLTFSILSLKIEREKCVKHTFQQLNGFYINPSAVWKRERKFLCPSLKKNDGVLSRIICFTFENKGNGRETKALCKKKYPKGNPALFFICKSYVNWKKKKPNNRAANFISIFCSYLRSNFIF